jgi:nicotinamidase-related amidase
VKPLDPNTTALLIMDVQAGILSRIEEPDAFVERVSALEKAARAAGTTVGYVRVAFTEDDYASIPAHSSFAAIAQDDGMRAAMAAESPSTAIDPRVAPQAGDIVVRKTRVGPFSTTDLDAELRARGIHTLVLTGISTSGVVLSTVRQGADLDYRIVVVSDAVADYDAEAHRVLTGSVFPRQGEVVSSVEVLEVLASSSP